jgi:hypothetical protein
MSNFPALPTGSSRNKIEFLYDLLSGLGGGGSSELIQTMVTPIPSTLMSAGSNEKKFALKKLMPSTNTAGDKAFYQYQNDPETKVMVNGLVEQFKDEDPAAMVALTFSLNIPFRIDWANGGTDLTDAEKVSLSRFVRGSMSSYIMESEIYIFDEKIHLVRTGEGSTGQSFFSFLGECVVTVFVRDIVEIFDRYSEGFPIEIGIKMHGDLDGAGTKFNAANILFEDAGTLRLVGSEVVVIPPPPMPE